MVLTESIFWSFFKLFVLKLICPQNHCFIFLVIFNSKDADVTVPAQSCNLIFLELCHLRKFVIGLAIFEIIVSDL